MLTNGLITKHQHGFLAKRSTCTNLLDSFQDWVLALNGRENVDVAFIDFSKAFDSVSHIKLLHKLRGYGIQYELLAWIKSFLDHRTQRVLVDSRLSKAVPVRSGVVQGSVLGPLLFILFINDITEILDVPANCQLYADDIKLYSRIELDKPNALTSCLAKLKIWSDSWQLAMNCRKCSVMHLGPTNPDFQYSLGTFQLPGITRVCDLGVDYNNKLIFSDYIVNIVAKAYRRIYLIFRGFVSRNAQLLKQVYITYVRPLLEYCTPLWSPYLIKDIAMIENVQRYFTRRLFPECSTTYAERLNLLSIDSLELRRLKSDLKMYYKIIHGLVNLDVKFFFIFLPKIYGTRGHNYQIQMPIYHKNSLANTFAGRALNCWNHLPVKTVSAASLTNFKLYLNKADLGQYLH